METRDLVLKSMSHNGTWKATIEGVARPCAEGEEMVMVKGNLVVSKKAKSDKLKEAAAHMNMAQQHMMMMP